MTVVIGIDPGTHVTGFGIIKKAGRDIIHIENGIISPKSKLPLPERLTHIYSELSSIIKNFNPDEAALEDVFVSSNARSALLLGHARGIAMLALSSAGLTVKEYSARSVKLALVGYGNAEKMQVAQMVKRLLNLAEPPAADAADALAVAICHANTVWQAKACLPKTLGSRTLVRHL